MEVSINIWQGRNIGRQFLLFLFMLSAFFETVNCQCFRSLRFLTAFPDSNQFSSPGYPSSYPSRSSCQWRIYAQNDSHAIRLEIFNTDIEYDPFCSFDYGQVFDGSAPLYSTSLGKFCGTQTPTYVSTNSTMTLVFVSDSSKTAPGFQARYYSGLRDDLLDDIDTEAKSIDLAIVLGSTLGCLAFLVLLSAIFVLAYKYKQAKTKSQVRQRPRLPRPISSIQVQPYNDDDRCFINRQMPPAYEAIQGSSSSEPPGYTSGNNYERSTQNDSYPTKYSDEKIPVKKVAFGNSNDMTSNVITGNTSGAPGMPGCKGNVVSGDISAGTSGTLQISNHKALDIGNGVSGKRSLDAGPIPEKMKIQ